MGKVFITDEVNDMRTVTVTNAGKIKVESGAAASILLSSAQSILSGQRVSSTPCFLKSITIGMQPASAASLTLYNTSSAGLEGLTALNNSVNEVGKIFFTVGAASAAVCGLGNLLAERAPTTIPFDVYCSSGLVAAVSLSGGVNGSYLGNMKGVTISYQA
jgi:hypothetical protein